VGGGEPEEEGIDVVDAFGGFFFVQSIATMVGFFYCALTKPSHGLLFMEMVFVEAVLVVAAALFWCRVPHG